MQATVVANGSFALRLGSGVGIAETRAFDTSASDLVVWQYLGKRGPETPDVGDALVTSWWDGTAWVVGETWFGRGVTDATFSALSVVLDDPSARSPAFKLQFVSSGSGLGHDDFYVDDFELRCDGDDAPSLTDCDDAGYGGALDPGFGRVGFETSDPAALIAGLSVQFASSGSAASYDDFWLDDLSIGCAP